MASSKVICIYYFSLLFIVTLTPRTEFTEPAPWFNVQGTLEFGSNILLFIPLPIFFGVHSTFSSITVNAISIITSLTIELLQIWIPGRNSDLRDLLSNTIGVVLGWFCFKLLSKTPTE